MDQSTFAIDAADRLGTVRQEIARACREAGRDPDSVTLIAVMRKLRATGPHNGWQMIEWTRSSGSARFSELARGQVCTSCHFQARKTDYVFTKRR